MADFLLANHGSVLVLTPLTKPAEQFISDHLDHPETQHWGKGVVIEPRYWEDIEHGINEDGLSVVTS